MASVVTVYSQFASTGSASSSAAPSPTSCAARPVSPSVRAIMARYALHAPPAGVRAPCSIVRPVRRGQLALEDSDRHELHAEEHSGVVVLRGEPDPGAFGGQPRGLVGSTAEQREHRLPHRPVPRVRQEAEVVGQATMRLDRLLRGGEVAELEEVDDRQLMPCSSASRSRAARAASMSSFAIARRSTTCGRTPERDVTRVQRLQQRTPAGAPAARERLLAQAFTDRRGAVVQLDGQPGQERRAQGRAGVDAGDRLLEQRPNLRAHRCDHDRQTRGSQRSAGEEHAVVR